MWGRGRGPWVERWRSETRTSECAPKQETDGRGPTPYGHRRKVPVVGGSKVGPVSSRRGVPEARKGRVLSERTRGVGGSRRDAPHESRRTQPSPVAVRTKGTVFCRSGRESSGVPPAHSHRYRPASAPRESGRSIARRASNGPVQSSESFQSG